jgi:molecular chaperone DnaJ
MVTAALGGKVQVPTLGGKAEIDLPEGTQSGKTFRLRGKGIKGVRSSYPGDLYARVVVETPVRLNEAQKKLLRELEASLHDPKHSPQARGWMDKVREFFQ